ncbi:hypothetical protein C8Q75DRAFT_808214 [Abortiporus biennis]|nr:hypothetical protein C8Q75DRAFT_808214 [Abortiporus biennis]
MSFSSRGTGSRLHMGAPAIHHSRSSSGSRLVSYSGVKPKASLKKLPRVLPGQSVSFPQTEVLSLSSVSHMVEDDDSSSLFHFDFPVDDVMLTPSDSVALSTEEEYWHVLDTIGETFHLDVSLFVMQDWDKKIGSYWYISRQPRSAEEVAIACTCPSYRAQNMCLHQQVFLSHLDEFLAQTTIIDPTSGSLPPAIFLHSTPFNDIYVFSCVSSSSIGRFESGKRVIHAVEFAVEAGFVSESLELPSTQDTISNGPSDDEALLASVGSHSDEISSVSYKPIPPPRWCSLPSEPSYTAQYQPAWSSTNTHFDLDVTSRCSCGSSLLQSTLSAELHDIVNAVIFGLTIQTDVTVSVYPCILCHHRS